MHTFQKVLLLSHQVLEVINKVFGKCSTGFYVLFGQQWFLPRNSPVEVFFAQFLLDLFVALWMSPWQLFQQFW